MSTLALVFIAIAALNLVIAVALWLARRDAPVEPARRPRIPTAGPDQPTMPLPRPDLLANR